jgi:hypothetical protein
MRFRPGYIDAVLLACVFGRVVRAAGQSSRTQLTDRHGLFIQTDHHGSGAAVIHAVCDSVLAGQTRGLFTLEDELSKTSTAAAGPSLSAACIRAQLAIAGKRRDNGSALTLDAIASLHQMLTMRPSNTLAAELLGAIALETTADRVPAMKDMTDVGARIPVVLGSNQIRTDVTGEGPVVADLIAAVDVGVRDPFVLRACTSLAIDVGDEVSAHSCSLRALASGIDSTWHLLRLSWLAFVHGDTTSGLASFRHAAGASHTSEARADLGWHLENAFLQPSLAETDQCVICFGSGLLSAFEENGVISDRNQYRLTDQDREQWFALADSQVMPWIEQQVSRRTTLDADTGEFAPHAHLPGRFADGGPDVINARLRGSPLVRHLMAHFWFTSYSGGTFRATWVWGLRSGPQPLAVAFDNAYLSAAVTMLHLWDPTTRRPVDVVPYAIPISELAWNGREHPTANLKLRLVQWSPGISGQFDTILPVVVTRPTSSSGHEALVGFFELPFRDRDAWEFTVAEGSRRRGGKYRDLSTPLGHGPLELSDLVLGGDWAIKWAGKDGPVPLSPSSTFNREHPVQLYYQVDLRGAQSTVQTEISLFEVVNSVPPANPVTTVRLNGSMAEGLNEVRRELDVSQLKAGQYLLRVTIQAGGERAQRDTPLILQ